MRWLARLCIIGPDSHYIPQHMKPPKKLTRDEIRQGMDQIPVEILLSGGRGKKPALTAKQREFARQVALGETKAQAYRKAYREDVKPRTVQTAPYELASNPAIAREIEAYKLAIEAEKHRTPAQLKSLLVQQLVQHSLDNDFPPAQRVQCLKLLGSLFEVGAFVERKEVVTTHRSDDIRARLLETLADVTDVTPTDDGLDLLAEIAGSVPSSSDDLAEGQIVESQDPTAPPPPHAGPAAPGAPTHNVPHTESHPNSSEVLHFPAADLELVPLEDPPGSTLEEKGVGGV